jgi:hypothetical protein
MLVLTLACSPVCIVITVESIRFKYFQLVLYRAESRVS